LLQFFEELLSLAVLPPLQIQRCEAVAHNQALHAENVQASPNGKRPEIEFLGAHPVGQIVLDRSIFPEKRCAERIL